MAWSRALAPLVLLASLAPAQGVPWSHPDGTTHWYEAVSVPGGITWDAAHVAANAAGGYLVTLTSAAENDFVFSVVDFFNVWSLENGPWTGGLQLPSSLEPGGGWTWAELETFGYTNWAPGQPDDSTGPDRLHFGGGTGRVKTWADAPQSTLLPGYVIERSGATVPRTVGLLQREAGSFDGYTLFSPMNWKLTYLIDPRGRLVHTWTSAYAPGLSAQLLPNGNLLRAGRVNNPAFPIGGNGGVIEEIDWQDQVIWSYTWSSPTQVQHHDATRLPNGNVMFIAWELKSQSAAIAAGRDPALLISGQLWPDAIIEVKPTGSGTAQVVWEWHAWDHMIQDRDATKANYGVVGQHPELIDLNYPLPGQGGAGLHDWMHSNCVVYNADLDQVMLSVRHFNEFWVIDHSTTTAEAASHAGGRSGKGGDILYRWGNPAAYRAGTASDRQLFQHHDPQWIAKGLPGAGRVLVFDNGMERTPVQYSRVLELTPPQPDQNGIYPRPGAAFGPAQPDWVYAAPTPTDFFSLFAGGVQRLPNGNTLICSSWQGSIFEVTPQGQPVWKYSNPVDAQRGPLTQGTYVSGNPVFRGLRYTANDPALSGRNLTPSGPLEAHDPVLLAEGSTVAHEMPVGNSVAWTVRSRADAGKLYLVGTSATPGLLPVDNRFLRVGYDELLLLTLSGGAPQVFQNYVGFLDPQGRAAATLVVPPAPVLAGLVLHTTFLVVDYPLPSGVATLGNTVRVTLRP